jgi:NADH dehydrogenase
MILVAGGSGLLGAQIVMRFTARNLAVRVLTRDPSRVRSSAHLRHALVELVPGVVRDPAACDLAASGVTSIVSAVQGFAGPDAASPEEVDWQGNVNLIRAAQKKGVQHFVLVSVIGASPAHPMSLFRMKQRAEDALRASGIPWTIIRASAFMELWTKMLGDPLIAKGRTVIFGRGTNPINFVSVRDVAHFIELAVVQRSMRGVAIDVDGENLSFTQFVETIERESGKHGTARHVPRPMMRLASVVMRVINPTLARQIQGGVVMDTTDMTSKGADRARRYPAVPVTTLAEVVRRNLSL